MDRDERIIVDSVVQANEKFKEGWRGCLIQVDEIKSWGIQGWVQLPMQGSAYIRLKWDEMDYIGQAVLGPKREEEEGE